MKYQDFENGLKGKLQNATEHVDVNALILNIHAAKPKKDRKLILWLFLCTSILVLGFAGVHYIGNKKQSVHSENITNLSTESAISEPLIVKKIISSIPVSQSLSEKPQNHLQNKKISIAFIAKKPTQESKEVFKAIAINEKNILSKPSVKRTTNLQAEEKIHSDSKTILSTSGNLPSSISKSNLASNAHLSTLAILPLLDAQLENKSLLFSDPILCPTFRKRRWALDLIPEIGIIMPIKNLTNNSTEANPVFTMRSEEERTLEGIQAALYLRLRPVQKPIYLKFGVSYTRISEQMKLNTSWVERDTTVGIISITQSQSGDTITTIYGDIITETENSRKSSDHYYLHLVDLPISLGYNKSLGNGWRLGAEAGVQVNLSFRSSGKILEGSGENSFTNLPADGRFRARLGLSYFGGFTLEKTLSPRTAFYITPRMRFFNSTFTPENYSISQHYIFAGFHTGFVYTIR